MFAARAMLLTGVGPPPTITGISPTSAYTGSWFTMTITGTNFISGATTVSVGGSTTSSVTVNSAGTSLTVSVYAYYAGAFNVSVTTPGGTATYGGYFTGVTPPPPVTVSSYSFSDSILYIYGTNISGCQVYCRAVGVEGYKTVYDYGSYLMVYTGSYNHGAFFLYNATTGGGTSWYSY